MRSIACQADSWKASFTANFTIPITMFRNAHATVNWIPMHVDGFQVLSFVFPYFSIGFLGIRLTKCVACDPEQHLCSS